MIEITGSRSEIVHEALPDRRSAGPPARHHARPPAARLGADRAAPRRAAAHAGQDGRRGADRRGRRSATSSRSLFQAAADDNQQSSISHRLRARRFAAFERVVDELPKPVRIIDLGGTKEYWEQRGWAGREDVSITLVNLEPQPQRHANIVATQGDATDLSEHADGSFDIAFSNSVIEHLFTFETQAKMAARDPARRAAPTGCRRRTSGSRSSPTSSSRSGTGCRRRAGGDPAPRGVGWAGRPPRPGRPARSSRSTG